MGFNGHPDYKPKLPSTLELILAAVVFVFFCYGLGQSYKRDVIDVYQKESK